MRMAELDEVALERRLEPGDSGLRAFGGPAEGRVSPAGCGRTRVAAAPALQQAAKGEPGRLTGGELCNEAPRRFRNRRVSLEHGGPFGPGRLGACASAAHVLRAHSSTITGRIIGRRPVRS